MAGFAWHDLQALFYEEDDPDAAVEIGWMPQAQCPTAMRVGPLKAGGDELVYLGETEISVTPTWKQERLAVGGYHSWFRMEAKVSAKTSPITKVHDLVMAEWPYRNGWVHHAPFRPRFSEDVKKGKIRPRTEDQASIKTGGELVEWLEGKLKYDYWEKDRNLTAGISAPQPAVLDDADRVHIKTDGRYLFGACADYSDCEAQLFQSEAVAKLLAMTEANTIKFAPKGVDAGNIKLYQEVIDDATTLIYLSIRQALAGPNDDSDDWLERPVTERVDQLYRNHLNNRNRAVAKRMESEPELAQPVGKHDDESDSGPREIADSDNGRVGLTQVEVEVEKERYQQRQGKKGK